MDQVCPSCGGEIRWEKRADGADVLRCVETGEVIMVHGPHGTMAPG